LPIAGAAGAYKGIDAWRQASLAKQAQAAAEMQTEKGRMTRFNARVPTTMPSPTTTMPSPTTGFPRGPVSGPISPGNVPVVRESVGVRNMPGTAATGTAATGVMARGAEYAAKIRELAAQKALQGAQILNQPAAPISNLVKGGVGATAALMPGNVGQNYNVPTTGPLRGSEINPETRRPWTPEELARYNAQYNR
jgi:hypothetical protein